jgi:hypothetical protein
LLLQVGPCQLIRDTAYAVPRIDFKRGQHEPVLSEYDVTSAILVITIVTPLEIDLSCIGFSFAEILPRLNQTFGCYLRPRN